MKRRTMATVLVASVLTSATAGWVASATIRSPAEVAARTKAPPASTILVPVEQRALATKVVARGTARFGLPQQLALTQSALKAGPGVVSHIGTAGTELHEGDVAMVQSGRPVLVIAGRVPAFRDLGPGLEGADVWQLQQALIRMGLQNPPASGVYNGRTEAAVARLYHKAGFDPFVTTPDQLAEIRVREADLLTARLEVLATSDGLGLAGSDTVSARAALDEARRNAARAPADLADARAWARETNEAAAAEVRARQDILEAVRSGTKGSPAEQATARADLETARADELETHQAGTAAVQEAADEVARLTTASADAREALADAIAVGQDNVAAASAALDEVLDDPNSSAAAIAAARAALTSARAEAAAAERDARAALADADRALASARVALDAARARAVSADQAARSRTAAAQAALDAVAGRTKGTPSEVAAAAAEVAAAKSAAVTAGQEAARLVAEAEVAARAAGLTVAPARAALSLAERNKANAGDALALRQRMAQIAAADLGTAQRQAGVQIPADEIVVVSAAPIRISEALVAPGATGDGPVMQVTNATVAVDSSLALDEAALIEPGMPVQLDEPELGIAAEGRISQVAPTPGTNGVDGFHIYFEVLVDGNPPSLPGVSVRITVPVETSQGESLVVPVGAVSLAPDGTSKVQVDRDGTIESLTVVPGLVADGYVAITPEGGSLVAGDQVVVGAEAPSGA